jgi:amylovoran biosynthesis glycosyltransferase AmsE
MSVYNAESAKYLEECLISLHSQVLKATEVVLVLDGPIHCGLSEVIERWKEPLNMVIVPLKVNVGLSKALNVGLTHCQYELVARMDADDICKPERFLNQINFINSNFDIDISGAFCEDISESGESIRIRKVPIKHVDILKNIWACPFIHPSVIFRKSKIIKLGSYNENAPHRQDDYELWIRAASAGLKFGNIPEVLIKYRIPANAHTKNTVKVGFNRARIGFKAVCKFDPRLTAFLGLMYPLIRSLLPNYIQNRLAGFVSKFDPRIKD